MTSSGLVVAGEEVPIHVINLDSRPDRWDAIQTRLAAHGLTARRFPALTGQDARDLGYRARVPAVEQREWRLGAGALGCAASHLEIYRRVAQDAGTGSGKGAVILEDDAVLADRFALRAQAALENRSRHTSLVSLGWLFFRPTTGGRVLDASRRLRGMKPRDRLAVQPFQMGCHCYWVGSDFSAAASELMSPVFAPIDAMLRALTHYASWQAEAHWPPLATQDASSSDIQGRA